MATWELSVRGLGFNSGEGCFRAEPSSVLWIFEVQVQEGSAWCKITIETNPRFGIEMGFVVVLLIFCDILCSFLRIDGAMSQNDRTPAR